MLEYLHNRLIDKVLIGQVLQCLGRYLLKGSTSVKQNDKLHET